jgi:hypothetical protein
MFEDGPHERNIWYLLRKLRNVFLLTVIHMSVFMQHDRARGTPQKKLLLLIINKYLICTAANLTIKLLKPTGHVMHHQFNIQQLYALPTLCLCVLYLSENEQRLVPLTA